MNQQVDTIILGSMNTDLVVADVPKLLESGELTIADRLEVAAGGKSRNIAVMLATLLGDGRNIAFLGKTIKDKFGFWKYPIDSLTELKIGIESVDILEEHSRYKLPGLAIIPIDKDGHNQIYLVQGINNDFNADDIRSKEKLFEEVGAVQGILSMALEMLPETATAAIQFAKKYKLKLFLDPGGIEGRPELLDVVKEGGYLIKSNEHEAELISGVKVEDAASAKAASEKILALGYEVSVITHGEQGGYLSYKDQFKHIKAPKIDISMGDSVGCGDQTMAGIVYAYKRGLSIEEAVNIGVTAGTLQHTKKGVVPVTLTELTQVID